LIEYIGRIDHQVKIRGFRIELGEIESVLRQHPALQDVVVLAREDIPGDKRLVAYVVPHSTLPTIDSLRQFVQRQLPVYMVPSAFATIDSLPLTANGKLDRKALPLPDDARPNFELEFVGPRTPTEQEVATIWVELLGMPDIGVYDNFFALGGHSLLATQLMVRVRDTFGIELFLRDFFEAPTIDGLASLIVQQLAGQQDEAELAEMLAQLEQLEQFLIAA
jgi:acyl carrier protein